MSWGARVPALGIDQGFFKEWLTGGVAVFGHDGILTLSALDQDTDLTTEKQNLTGYQLWSKVTFMRG